jgi:hypothetical protein
MGGSALLLLSALAIAAIRMRDARLFVRPEDRMLVEMARKDARAIFTQETSTFPIVMRLSDRNCVELRSNRADGAGSYLACYDPQTDRKTEERASTGF